MIQPLDAAQDVAQHTLHTARVADLNHDPCSKHLNAVVGLLEVHVGSMRLGLDADGPEADGRTGAGQQIPPLLKEGMRTLSGRGARR